MAIEGPVQGLKMIFDLFKSSKKSEPNTNFTPSISREELREFLINNRLQGDLLVRVNALKAQQAGLSNYQAVEMLMDHLEKDQ